VNREAGTVRRDAQKKGRKAPRSKAERQRQEPFYHEGHEDREGFKITAKQIFTMKSMKDLKGDP
jgi:hypothetical protein